MKNVTVQSQYFAGKQANVANSEARAVVVKDEDGNEHTEFIKGNVTFDKAGFATVPESIAKALVAGYPSAVSIVKTAKATK